MRIVTLYWVYYLPSQKSEISFLITRQFCGKAGFEKKKNREGENFE